VSHYSDSFIFVILLVTLEILLVNFMILSDIIEISLSHLKGLVSHSYRLHHLQLLAVPQLFFILFSYLVFGIEKNKLNLQHELRITSI
jgi:hypothetical protein